MEPQRSGKKTTWTPLILGAKPGPEAHHGHQHPAILSSRTSDGATAPTAPMFKIMRDEAPEQLTSEQLKLIDENFEFCGEHLEKVR
jgi:hypothetical protein